jgi:enoyl-CoA hydratase
MFELATEDGVAVLTLAHGRANAMDTAFCRGVGERLTLLRDGPEKALVITATGRIFSAGVDLTQLVGGGASYVAEFLPAFKRMCMAVWAYPKPVVVALNGHAIAGGCIIACAADHRVMVRDAGRIGVRYRVRSEHTEALLLGGETVTPERAIEVGLVDELVDAAALQATALARAHNLARVPGPLYALTKAMLRQPARTRMDRLEQEFGAQVDALWSAPDTLNAISEYIARTLHKA